MLNSMTGYGRQKAETQQREISVEIKSVNHRYLDFNIKVPRIYSFLEEAVKSTLTGGISRGKVDVYVSVRTKDGKDAKVSPNLGLAEEYIRALVQLRDRFQLNDDVTVMKVAQLPEVLAVDKDEPDAELVKGEVLQVVRQTLAEYNAMRGQEGARLCQDIALRADLIEELVAQVEQRSPICAEEYRQKISARMQELLGESEITEQRILSEAAVFSDKISVTEEIVRLRSHLSQLRAMIAGSDAVGRKLDFLVQEMNREANTIGSKANDYEIAQKVIDLKAEIEKIREQVQNLE